MVKEVKEKKSSAKILVSDYFFAFGFLFFIPFAVFSWKFMVTPDPKMVPFISVPMIITCFLLCLVSWGVYFFFENKAGRLKSRIDVYPVSWTS